VYPCVVLFCLDMLWRTQTIPVHPMIVEAITSVFPSCLGNTEVLLLVDASSQSISRDLAFLTHWSFSRYAALPFGCERVSRNDDWGKKGPASLAVFCFGVFASN